MKNSKAYFQTSSGEISKHKDYYFEELLESLDGFGATVYETLDNKKIVTYTKIGDEVLSLLVEI